MGTTTKWTKKSWQNFTALQQPKWPDMAAHDAVVERLSSLPPLVFAGEIYYQRGVSHLFLTVYFGLRVIR